MKRAAYQTNIEESVLQSRGPHRIPSTGEVMETVKPEFTVIGKSVVFGRTEMYGKRVVPQKEPRHQQTE